ncbi:S-adenosyl-L-methionine-dependent methyltransferase [Lophiotrema nucula]|uniref:S-adenosyl-L-methionine-dependent methyltransferase n=1 Tax=Lophiotrema nucula TaxID=690887 RepID=A0A6A5YER1_9PLEO|nr:S-adenosyl-L-methionine-dependent methyltransferase [Lophiotrema nucula]
MEPERRWLRLRYIAGVMVMFASLLFSLAASKSGDSPTVQDLYESLESRMGYWLILGNTRHCGLYRKGQISPFPIAKAQRAMEEKMYMRLNLKPGSKVLDAGAGSGFVAIYMARKGLSVQAVDITPHHLADAKKNVKKHHLEDKITVDYGDYHDLDALPDASFDGIYTMETFVHADDPAKVLNNFYRLLKPGGVIVFHEADVVRLSEKFHHIMRLSHCQNTLKQGGYEKLIKDAGFINFTLEDLTEEVLPLWRFFGILGYLPYQLFKLLGIQDRFINVMAGVESWMNWGDGRYISVRAVKA